MIDLYQLAHDFAVKAHGSQKRKYDKVPYIVHLEGVARILIRYDHRDPVLQAAALLHDTLEDTDVTVEDLIGAFGPEIAELVYWLTDAETGKRKIRKLQSAWRLSRAPFAAKLIKLADLIDNSESILQHDRQFAPVYLAEKAMILTKMAEVEGERLLALPLYLRAKAISLNEADTVKKKNAKKDGTEVLDFRRAKGGVPEQHPAPKPKKKPSKRQ